MSITILNRPYDGLVAKINPVYNGLGFVVNSDKKQVNNFRYISEIYANNIKVAELRHNPDISNNNYGMFDVGRILESYLSYNLNWNVTTGTSAPKALIDYYINFGEEFSRVGTITSWSSAGYPNAGKVRVGCSKPHNLVTGDRVLIEGSTNALYNGYKNVYVNSTTSFTLTTTNYTGSTNISTMYFVQGEKINRFTTYVGADGVTYVLLRVKQSTVPHTTTFTVGDTFSIAYDNQPNLTQYLNIEWTILGIVQDTNWASLKTNIPYASAISSLVTGSITSRNNFVLLNKFSTKNDNAKTFNGVTQYEDFLTWSPTPYLMFGTASPGQYLTGRPDNELKVCTDDYMTLSMFGKSNWSPFYPTAPTLKTICETHSTPTVAIKTGTINNVAGPAPYGQVLTITVASTTGYNAGDYISVVNAPNAPYTGRVLSLTSTVITTDIYYLGGSVPNCTIVQTEVVKFRQITTPLTRCDIPAGPKNLNYTEITNGTCFEYYIYEVNNSISSWWLFQKYSETWTFNIECHCSKNKKFTLMWLNELGGWDFYNFTMRSDKGRKIEKQKFSRHLKSYQGTAGYKYKMGERGSTTYNVVSNDNYIVRTDWINQPYLDWLAYLYESPEVYWIDETSSKIYPIDITNTEVELFNKINRGDTGTLYKYEVNFMLSNSRTIQRGGNFNVNGPSVYTGIYSQTRQ
jgi:hypothetical protein